MDPRRWWLALVLCSMAITACGEEQSPQRGVALGATGATITAADGTRLDARFWPRSGDRAVIYVHEFREDQSSWWGYAAAQPVADAAALTVDLRGHGESEGEPADVEGMLLDVEAAVAFVRAEGYPRVMVVGAGMGGAVAIVAAQSIPDMTVVGLSAPVEFGELAPLGALVGSPEVAERVWLLASRGDVSGANSIGEFRTEAGVGFTQSRIYPGHAHGIEMLDGEGGTNARRLLTSLLEDFWVAGRTAAR